MQNKNLYIGLGVAAIIVIALLWSSQSQESAEQQPQANQEADQAEQSDRAFGESVEWAITGIEPGAGIMINTEKAMQEYGLEDDWKLKESSSAAMLAALQDSIANEEPIVVTVWEPHAAFSIANIRKLEDSKNIFNSPDATREFLKENAPEWADADVASDVLATVVYKGFADDAPAAAEFFKNFNVPADYQSEWIYEYSVNEKEAETVASEFLAEHEEEMKGWMPAEDTELGKDKITIGIPPWPGATVKSRVVAQVLQEIGYETEIKEMDASVVYASIADKQVDVNVAGWMPTTHADYWEEFKDDLEIAGINVTQSWLGLGVPDYVDSGIQSLEDLAK
ncbi:hypothetical protein GF391_00175 [Candidatus Uhrbacteria bacterium]|nr:hypothetical protein [Candidatus Uhrbacteria bacterium]